MQLFRTCELHPNCLLTVKGKEQRMVPKKGNIMTTDPVHSFWVLARYELAISYTSQNFFYVGTEEHKNIYFTFIDIYKTILLF